MACGKKYRYLLVSRDKTTEEQLLGLFPSLVQCNSVDEATYFISNGGDELIVFLDDSAGTLTHAPQLQTGSNTVIQLSGQLDWDSLIKTFQSNAIYYEKPVRPDDFTWLK